MECNKDEAIRAKEIAEKKFAAKDIFGAKKFALKAQNLYPNLEGISQLIITFDVYISTKNRITGEPDWYGILGMDRFIDENTLRKQYRKLAFELHPDKNKSIGAHGAFILISEAWKILSDKGKRVAYDEKINAKGSKVSTNKGASLSAENNTSSCASNDQKKVPKEENAFSSFCSADPYEIEKLIQEVLEEEKRKRGERKAARMKHLRMFCVCSWTR
ncbi:hypothetical protein TanjilG_10938 [Lupinus angustifolius]|uniref:J domain-containing protein n=1 Tax=Lupinus angustifolius TaxID=3871 RepID=A0A1J7G5C3_LUPAN|nr:PREDICTED: chaperone protein dnaJ 49-like [Lupinus angustifolius]OIV95550.1 hypothetical protein TanjilG_10938 [Lupinus angustifolius]